MRRMTFVLLSIIIVFSSIGIAAGDDVIPAFWNRIESRNSIDMTSVSLVTGIHSRFVNSVGSLPVDLRHHIRVSEYDDVPSVGSVSTSLEVIISEARTGTIAGGGGTPNILSNRIEFHERTSVDGEITLFERLQHYESGSLR